MRTLLDSKSHASGDIGPILLVFMLIISIYAMSFAFGAEGFYNEFKDTGILENETSYERTSDSGVPILGPMIDFFTDISNLIRGFFDTVTTVMKIVWDIATFDLPMLEDIQVVRFFLLIVTGFFWIYVILKFVRGF